MKQIINLLIIILLISVLPNCNKPNSNNGLSGTISISGAWALYPIVIKWSEEFSKIHPNVSFDIAAGGAGKGMADVLSGAVDIGNVSREIYNEEIERGAWFIPVTKDAVVPTFNTNNPYKKDIMSKGFSRTELIDIWIKGDLNKWNLSKDNDDKNIIHVYTRSDACGAAKTWALYLESEQEDMLGVGVYGDPGVAEAVKNDVSGIGYNNINYAYDSKSGKQIDGICVLPIDLNNDNVIDEDENFYQTREELIQAIKNNIYPSTPSRELYLVTKGKPEREIVVEFLKWVLREGQQYVDESGYIRLSEESLNISLISIQ